MFQYYLPWQIFQRGFNNDNFLHPLKEISLKLKKYITKKFKSENIIILSILHHQKQVFQNHL